MDQFMKLPGGQKAAVLGAILAVIGLGMYFLLVDPQLGRAQAAQATLKKTEKELTDLKAAASMEELAKLRKLNDELNEKNKEAKKMLPPTEEVPDLIDTVQADAVHVGLQVKKFERLKEEPQDQYVAIPVRMVVEGKMNDLIRFMRIYAGNDRRVVHLKELQIEQQPPDADTVKQKLTNAAAPTAAARLTETPETKLLAAIQEAELVFELVTVRATFTAYAYTWTGKPAPGGLTATPRTARKRT
jgi:Tfp pilus assembly protein PilO